MKNQELVKKLFVARAPKANQVFRANLIRQQIAEAAETIAEYTRESAEQTLAIRKLHEALMHAESAIYINED